MNLDTIFNPTIELGKGTVVVDGEILDDLQDLNGRFKNPQDVRVSVMCTLSDKHGFRDWVGDESVAKLIKYLQKFSHVVGFNHIRFDNPLMGGALVREFERGGDHESRVRKAVEGYIDLAEEDPTYEVVNAILRGRNIDLHLDIYEFMHNVLQLPRKGRRARLDNICHGMLGEGKFHCRFDGGHQAPKAWRENMALEVISYCRIDVYRAAQIFCILRDGGVLKNMDWPQKGINEFDGKVTLKLR